MDAAKMHATACQYAAEQTQAALDAALETALPLCALIARRFSGRGVEYEDLYQVAAMACVSALRGFDPGRGLKFTTFVTPTITGTVRNYLRDKGSLVHTPRTLREEGARLSAARQAYVQEHHEEPSARELAQALGWEMSRVLSVLAAQASGQVASLDQEDEEGLRLADRLASPEQGFEKMEQRQDLKRAMAQLSRQEQQLLLLRFREGLSQRQIAAQMDMTQMQVSRMERRALAALRREMEGTP